MCLLGFKEAAAALQPRRASFSIKKGTQGCLISKHLIHPTKGGIQGRHEAVCASCMRFVDITAGASENATYAVGLNAAEFQLALCGNLLQRDVPADRDPRVLSFNPDPWQRKVCGAFILKSTALLSCQLAFSGRAAVNSLTSGMHCFTMAECDVALCCTGAGCYRCAV